MIAFTLGPVTVEILDGDISTQDVDAVVNAANNHFWMGAGVAGALKARGGRTIEAEAMALGPVEAGASVTTSGGRLAARHVIHAAVMGQDLVTSASIIEQATRSALDQAEKNRLSSIAFPAFGTGVGGFPVRDCARIMIDVVRAYRPTAIRLIRFVLFGNSAYRAFAETAADRLGPPSASAPDCPIST